jgi:hypothetical protein
MTNATTHINLYSCYKDKAKLGRSLLLLCDKLKFNHAQGFDL